MTGLIIATGLAIIILACGLAAAGLAVRDLLRLLGPFLDSLGPVRARRQAPPGKYKVSVYNGHAAPYAYPRPTFDERMAASVTALDHSDVLAIVCRACNDEDGPCTCAGLCGHRDCVGDHTVLHDMAAELEAMLDGGGHEDCDELGRPQ